MTQSEFDTEMTRLKNVFGDRHYPDERLMLIWKEVRQQVHAWLNRVVSEFIGCRSLNQPPLVPDFRKAMSEFRNTSRAADRAREANDANEFYHGEKMPMRNSRFSKDEITDICQTIIRRCKGEIPDDQWDAFRSDLERATS